MGSTWEWRQKPARPVFNRAHGLARGCVFASAPGWVFGAGTGASPIGELENLRNQRGIWNAAVGNHSPWDGGTRIGGRGLDNGDGTFTSAPEFTIPAGDTRFDITLNMTAAVLVRPDVLSTDATIPIFKRRDQPYAAANPGWHFSAKALNQWRFAFSDGVTERSVGSTTSGNVFRGDLLLATAEPTKLNLYINGQVEGSPAFAATSIGNPSGTPIKFLGLGTAGAGQPNYAGLVSVGYVWNRVLSQGEINALAVDPFVLFRPLPSFEEEALAQYQTFMACM